MLILISPSCQDLITCFTGNASQVIGIGWWHAAAVLQFCLPAVPSSIAKRLGITIVGKHVAAATVGFFSPRVMGVGTW